MEKRFGTNWLKEKWVHCVVGLVGGLLLMVQPACTEDDLDKGFAEPVLSGLYEIENLENVALGKPVAVSSYAIGWFGSYPGENAVDGNLQTRWSSAFTDLESISVDLGYSQTIKAVALYWEAAYAVDYAIQVSDDGIYWKSVYHETNGNGGLDIVELSETARYVGVVGIDRATNYGYSLWELEVYGDGSGETDPDEDDGTG